MKYKLSKLALKDVDGIWEYTLQNWSRNQANKYYKEIFKEIDFLCSNPEIGKSIDEVVEGFRLRRIKSHVIIYQILETKISVDRILHRSMDVDVILNK